MPAPCFSGVPPEVAESTNDSDGYANVIDW